MDSDRDDLTRLPGREGLRERLDEEIARAERYGSPLSLLLAQVDDFGTLEASRGGETLLRRLTLLLLSTTRESDLVARVGSDRFAVLLPDTDDTEANVRAERLGAEVAATDLGDDGAPRSVRLSIGVATFGPGQAEGAALLVHAEEALRRAGAERASKDSTDGDTVVRAFAENKARLAETWERG